MMRLPAFTAIIAVLLVLCSCAEKKKSGTDQAEVTAKFHEYATRSGASADWEKSMPGGSIAESYTFQLEDALLADKRPIAVRATLYDVNSEFDEYAVVMQVTGVDRPEFKAKAEPDADTGQRVEVDFPGMVVITGDCIGLQLLDGFPRGKFH
jgi:hypothetical protein